MDGEGTITLGRYGSWRYPTLSITSTDREILEETKRICGGGTICTVSKYKNRMKQGWIWKYKGSSVVTILETVLPSMHCPAKQRRAEYIIANYRKNTKRNGCYTEAQRAKKLAFEVGFFQL